MVVNWMNSPGSSLVCVLLNSSVHLMGESLRMVCHKNECYIISKEFLAYHSNSLKWETIFQMLCSVFLGADAVWDPVAGVRHPVIYPGLARLGAAVAGADQAYQGPPPVVLHHQGPPAVALAAVLASPVVTGTDHLVVDDDVDPLLPVPLLALPVVDHGDVHHLQRLGPEPAARLQGAPASGPAVVAHQVHVLRGQTDRRDVRRVVNTSVQPG